MNEISINDIQNLMWKRAVHWSYHTHIQMATRNISREGVRNAIMCGEIIEQYPSDYPHPSCLILGQNKEGRRIHVVCGVGGDNLWLITAYYPDESKEKWSDDFRVRKVVRK